LDSCFDEAVTDDESVYTIPFREGEFAQSLLGIKSDQFIYGQGDIISSRQPTTTIANNYSREYKGFVYNLSVADDESYLIDQEGIIVHNCRCWLERVGLSDIEDLEF
jgi:hypothetical protein